MRLAAPIKIGVPALVILALAAVMAFMAWGGGSGASAGLHTSAKFTSNVDWEHRSPAGKLIAGGSIKNALGASALDVIFDSIINDATTAAFKQIMAIDSTDDPSDGVAANTVTLTLDGDSGTGGDQNPAGADNGTGNAIVTPTDNSGSGTIAVTFTAGGTVSVKQILLVNTVETDSSGTPIIIPEADVLAFVDVPDVALTSGDTVKYTWTINFDP